MTLGLKHYGTKDIFTRRLYLRRFKKSDAEMMFENWAGDPMVTQYLSWKTHLDLSESRNVIRLWIDDYNKRSSYIWAIELRDTGEVIGSIGLHDFDERHCRCDTGYCLSRRWWGQGIMPEALCAVIGYGFEKIGLKRIQAYHHIKNSGSGRVMQKAGMKQEGVLRQYFCDNSGEQVDCVLYSIINRDLIV